MGLPDKHFTQVLPFRQYGELDMTDLNPDIFQIMEKRQSVRHYSSRPVEEKKLIAVLNAARISPSAKNRQQRKFIVIRNPETRKQLIEAARGQEWVGQAPVIIVCCGLDPEYRMTCGQPGDVIDVSIAIDHMTLAATALGLGTCWIGAFYQDQVKKIIGIPDHVQVVQLLVIGYPAGTEPRTPRKDLDDLVFYEKWMQLSAHEH
jgi:nitroreductase